MENIKYDINYHSIPEEGITEGMQIAHFNLSVFAFSLIRYYLQGLFVNSTLEIKAADDWVVLIYSFLELCMEI